MLSLYSYWYNHVRPNSAVRTKHNNRITLAMAAGLTDRPTTMEALVEIMDARTPKPRRPKTYKKARRLTGSGNNTSDTIDTPVNPAITIS